MRLTLVEVPLVGHLVRGNQAAAREGQVADERATTTFGSRVADGVYETLLDGMEIEELRVNEGIDILHYLMVDMLHMGFVDEVLFGKKSWIEYRRSLASG